MYLDHDEQEVYNMLKDKSSGAFKIIEAKNQITCLDSSNPYDGVTKKNFDYNKVTNEHEQTTKYKDGSRQANAMSIQWFLEHDLVEPIVTDLSKVASITYVLSKAGQQPIEEHEAFFNSRIENFDMTLKPVSRPRPGKRAAAEPAEPRTVQAPRTNGGCASRDAR